MKHTQYKLGDRYGSRTIIGPAPNKCKAKYVKVKCDCGRIDNVRLSLLVKGLSNKCYNCSHNFKNNIVKESWYVNWNDMKQRCLNVKNKRYKDYGGRGIKICDDWLDSSTFGIWAIANGYKDNLQIDRIDNNGDYCPENCRWATRLENSRNKRNSIFITINGNTNQLCEWCDLYRIKRHNVITNNIRYNISMENAIYMEVGKKLLKGE